MAPGLNGSRAPRRFVFERDTFAFANELVWEYRFDAATGRTTTVRNDPPPTYAHRCFVVARSARQFLYHARFDAALPAPDDPQCRRLIRDVLSRSPRLASVPGNEVIIPGYDGLRAFSQAQERLLKAECGGAWQSYFLRSHWRMVFPISRRHQDRTARQLVAAFPARIAPIVHLVRFPQLTINHGIVLFDWSETPTGLRFLAYDPNIPARPAELIYDRAMRTFIFPRNHYWPGGRVDVIETYCGWFY
jgi:hypothetical protein